MEIKFLLPLVALLLVCVNGAKVTQFTNCTQPCAVTGVLFPSSTTYLMQTGDPNAQAFQAWRSVDEGQTWTWVLNNVVFMKNSPANPLNVVIVQSDRSMYTSTDGGVTITKVSLPSGFALVDVSMHTSQASWLLAYACPSVYKCNTQYSKNFGSTWTAGPSSIAATYVLWGNDAQDPDIVYAILPPSYAFAYTKDYGTSWTSLMSPCVGYVLTDNYLYIGIQKGQTVNLYSSATQKDPTHTNLDYYWLDEFPTGNNLAPQGYTFLDDSSHAEYIALKQANTDRWGTLFTSDFYGDQFATSLNYIAEDDYLYDFDKFAGLDGIYMANAYTSPTSYDRQTMFTFDNGGEWKLLTPPATNSLGNPTNCSLKAGCSLHIHGLIAYYNGLYPPFYTNANAIGLMVGVGNLGTALSNTKSVSKTYFSRDAGITWAEIYNQPSIYDFGNHGGILVYASITGPTNTVYYSLDEGNSSQSFQFTNNALYVDNIFIEPQCTGVKFVLIGHTGNGPTTKYFIYGLDFSDLNWPTCGDADYENWSPSNGDNVNQFCFLGEDVVYKRRKQAAKCFNDRDTDHVVERTPCPCAWEDYECDIGFQPSTRNATDGFTCTPLYSSIPACATGYRIIPDTGCDLPSGINLQASNCPGYSGTPTMSTIGGSTSSRPSTTSSPNGGTTTSGKGGSSHAGSVVAIVLVFIILFGGAGTLGFLYWKNENFREWVLSKISRSPSQSYGRLNTNENDDEGDGPTV